jgi:hypothetical protein
LRLAGYQLLTPDSELAVLQQIGVSSRPTSIARRVRRDDRTSRQASHLQLSASAKNRLIAAFTNRGAYPASIGCAALVVEVVFACAGVLDLLEPAEIKLRVKSDAKLFHSVDADIKDIQANADQSKGTKSHVALLAKLRAYSA